MGVFSEAKWTIASQGRPKGERKGKQLICLSLPFPGSISLVKSLPIGHINFPRKVWPKFSRQSRRSRHCHIFWPFITFKPILYLVNVLISQSLLSKEEVKNSLNVLYVKIYGPGSASQSHWIELSMGTCVRHLTESIMAGRGRDSIPQRPWSKVLVVAFSVHPEGQGLGCICSGTAAIGWPLESSSCVTHTWLLVSEHP